MCPLGMYGQESKWVDMNPVRKRYLRFHKDFAVDSVKYPIWEYQNSVIFANSAEGVSTELSLNSVQLSQVVKTSAGSALDNSDYQKMALGMDGNDLHVKVPVSLGPVDSYLDLTMTGQVENNVMNLTVTGAKLGKMPIPKFLVLNYLKDQSNQNGGGFTVNGDQITLEIPQAGYSISKARVENGNAKVTISISLF